MPRRTGQERYAGQSHGARWRLIPNRYADKLDFVNVEPELFIPKPPRVDQTRTFHKEK